MLRDSPNLRHIKDYVSHSLGPLFFEVKTMYAFLLIFLFLDLLSL